jgi:hypothetical protein
MTVLCGEHLSRFPYPIIFSLEAFCDISYRLGGITPFGFFSDAFPGLKMWVTFARRNAIFLPVL